MPTKKDQLRQDQLGIAPDGYTRFNADKAYREGLISLRERDEAVERWWDDLKGEGLATMRINP